MAKIVFKVVTSEDAEIIVDGEIFYLDYSKSEMLDIDGEPKYDDEEDFIMHNITTLDENLVEEVVLQIGEKILPHIKKYIP